VVLDCKNQMTGDVVAQLQQISAQQGRIREMKNKLAAFSEVLARQDSAFGQLRWGVGAC
jgi:autophagy-related protein 11